MTIFSLALFALGTTSGDLAPPFVADSEGKVGFWEFGGSALLQDNKIMLVPPVQFKRGSVWTNVEIPSGSWALRTLLSIGEGSGGGGVGIWFSDGYGASGELNGGPRHFRGIGVVLSLLDSGRTIGFSIVQNKGTRVIEMATLTNPQQRIPFDRVHNVLVEVQFESDGKSVSVMLESGGNKASIDRETVTADLSDCYIGVTAQTDQFTSRIDLHSVLFDLEKGDRDVEEEKEQRQVSFADESPSGNYQPETRSRLRNPVFVKTEEVFQMKEKNKGRVTNDDIMSERVLDVVKELTMASNSVASFKELNEFVKGSMMNYTQKWHQRTMRIVEQVQNARNVMGAAWNYTHEMMTSLNSAIRMNSARTTFKVVDMAELMTSETEKLDEDTQKVVEMDESPFMMKFFVNTAVVELVCLVIFFILIQNQRFKDKVFKRSMYH